MKVITHSDLVVNYQALQWKVKTVEEEEVIPIDEEESGETVNSAEKF